MILTVWLAFSIAVGAYAKKRGYSGLNWFLFSLFLSPLIGLVVVFSLDDVAPKEEVLKTASLDLVSSIQKAHDLKVRDLISEDDFAKSKKEAFQKVLEGPRPELNDLLASLIPFIDSGAVSREEVEEIKLEISKVA